MVPVVLKGTISGIEGELSNAALEEVAVALNIRELFPSEVRCPYETINTSELVSRLLCIPIPLKTRRLLVACLPHSLGFTKMGS